MQQSANTIGYQELIQCLAISELCPSAAEAYGILCAMLCAGRPRAEESWIADLLAGVDEASSSAQECRRTLQDVANRTREEIRGSEIAFSPLLLDESLPLAERALGLYDFSRGFLYGLGLAGAETDRLSDQAREVIDDFSSITRLDLDGLEDSEDNEQALMELTEFVRVATLLVYEEQSRPGEPGG